MGARPHSLFPPLAGRNSPARDVLNPYRVPLARRCVAAQPPIHLCWSAPPSPLFSQVGSKTSLRSALPNPCPKALRVCHHAIMVITVRHRSQGIFVPLQIGTFAI